METRIRDSDWLLNEVRLGHPISDKVILVNKPIVIGGHIDIRNCIFYKDSRVGTENHKLTFLKGASGVFAISRSVDIYFTVLQ